MRPLIALSLTWITTIALGQFATAAPVSDALRTELTHLATDIAKIIEKNGGGAVAVGEFTASVEVSGHVGPRVQTILTEELENAGLSVSNSRHRFEVSGRYQPFQDTPDNRRRAGASDEQAQSAQGLNAVKLVAFLIDANTGEPLAERPTGRLIFGSETVPAMLGLNTSGPPLRDPKELSDNFGKALDTPQVEIRELTISGKTGRYAVQLLVKTQGTYQPQKVTLEDGKPFVELKPNDLYAVRLINNSPDEAAVELQIDGLNSFAFSDSESRYWVLKPNSQVDVIGWHRTTTQTTEFKVVDNFPETALAKMKLKPSATVGLITATFSACWADDADRPNDEPEVKGRGTGFGDDVELKTERVSRTIGQPRDTISLRYER
ncbi:MAG: hypothetical protein KDA86_25455 [Planctomycetaceae bacterium]|nr:hypothetical protein [Planctomycetaceae bacterium]MCA9035741.1 hypothetical protein [Planctomycetaceae bacterium]